tara:strand:+ start:1602 stop:2114 length:513 start_codon:yes stop_codon:yes gene_type:complete
MDKQKLKWIFGFGFKLAALILVGAVCGLMLSYARFFGGWLGGSLVMLHYFFANSEIIGISITHHIMFLIGGFVAWFIFGSIIGWIIFSIKEKVSMKLRGLITGLLIPLFWLIGFLVFFVIFMRDWNSFIVWLTFAGLFFIISLPIGVIVGFLIGLYIERRSIKQVGVVVE